MVLYVIALFQIAHLSIHRDETYTCNGSPFPYYNEEHAFKTFKEKIRMKKY